MLKSTMPVKGKGINTLQWLTVLVNGSTCPASFSLALGEADTLPETSDTQCRVKTHIDAKLFEQPPGHQYFLKPTEVWEKGQKE